MTTHARPYRCCEIPLCDEPATTTLAMLGGRRRTDLLHVCGTHALEWETPPELAPPRPDPGEDP